MICVLIGGVIGGFEYFNQNLIFAMIAVFFITSGSIAFNDYFDKDIDKKVHPNRPIPSGKKTPIQGFIILIIFFIISLFTSLIINTLCFFIAIITIDLLVLYKIRFKNQGIIGNLVVSFIVAISFSFDGASVDRSEMSIVFTLLAFF